MLTPERGKVYIVKHSSGLIQARFVSERVRPGNHSMMRRITTHYLFQNLKTGRDIVLKSRIKIKREVIEGGAL
jgi:hypothetical protein